MKLLIINASPRGTKSNTKLLFDKFIKGINQHSNQCSIEICYLNKIKKHPEFVEKFMAYDNILIGLPLYTDAMPGILMHFIELLPPSKGKCVGFFIQSGFPEAEQSELTERYFIKLSKRMQWNYIGSIIKGGVEALSLAPEFTKAKMYKNYIKLGKHYAKTGTFNQKIVYRLRNPFLHKKIEYYINMFIVKMGFTNIYWNIPLRKHKAYKNRFNAPYSNEL